LVEPTGLKERHSFHVEEDPVRVFRMGAKKRFIIIKDLIQAPHHPSEEGEDDLGRHSSSSSSQQVLPHPCIQHTQAGQSSNYRLKLQSPDTKRKHGT